MDNMTLQTVERALKILEIVAQMPLSQNEIGEQMGLNRTTTARLIHTLLSRSYLEFDAASNKYKLGLKVIELGCIKLNQLELKTEAVPFLRKLSLMLNQVCHMGILVDGEVVYIEKIEPITTIRMFSAIGKRVPVHSTSLGKALLSGLSNNEIISILKNKGMKSFTKNTLTNLDDIIKEVDRIRELGYGVDNEENEENIWCVSAPIKDYRNKIVAAISTSGHNEQSIKNESCQAIQLIKQTADSISERMGYRN